jgi:hypothetical protein
MSLEKATLINIDGGGSTIKFMFNPSMISFSRSMSIEQSSGARNSKGDNHTSFKHPNPYTVQIANIIIDTYEQGTSVLQEIAKFRDGVKFVGAGGGGGQKRPPIYLLTWGSNNYLRCFIKTLNFKLTLFLNDGTPVRATVDLTLEQVDNPTPQPGQGANSPSNALRQANGRNNTFLT